MVGAVIFLALLPALATSAGEGNIRLLEEDIAVALQACKLPDSNKDKEPDGQRQKRENENYSPRIDNNSKQEVNQYGHERRNTSDLRDQILVVNATDYDYEGYGTGNGGEKLVTSVPRMATGRSSNNNTNSSANSNDNVNRTKRSDPLLSKPDTDQCLSQCVFANLQVVDSRGIPREAELWNRVQSAVTSQQSRVALHDQIRACFQELQSEAEDNGCSYSNKLERCLMLRFADRKLVNPGNKQNQ